jgi:chromosome segregation ATPase
MDDETRAAFARIDRWFELSQAQHLELRQDVNGLREDVNGLREDVNGLREDVNGLREDVNGLRHRLDALYAEFRSFRDWAVVQFAELRGLIQQLTLRVERLERRQNDPIG